VRRKSSIDIAKRLDRIERARRMTPEARLSACVNLARTTLELQQSGKRYREEKLRNTRS
jgi:hypothetical protein